jgi:hypothetical protein
MKEILPAFLKKREILGEIWSDFVGKGGTRSSHFSDDSLGASFMSLESLSFMSLFLECPEMKQ